MYSRSLSRLFVGKLARRSSVNQLRYYGGQQYQWSRAKWNFRIAASTAVATMALSGGIAFALHASTSRQNNQSAPPSKADDDQV